jgi:DNA-binding CsgD family transcriptional regulator
MIEIWRLILLFVPLIAGAISIFFAYRLMKRFRAPFSGSFFYFTVFLYIFGTYSLAGAGILDHILTRMEIDQNMIHSARLFAIFLGIPFLALAEFMFLRSITEFLEKKPSNILTIPYFAILTAVFILYGVYTVRISRFNLGDYELLLQIQRWVFSAFMLIIYLSSFLYIISSTRNKSDLPSKKYLRNFGAWYFAYMVLIITSLTLSDYLPILRQFFFLIFLSWHLIPILFMNIYLSKYQNPESELPDDFESRLQAFVEEHDISKRECEVVRQICRGLSNQEISETLYISVQTVKDHIHRIFVKTGVKNRVQLTNMIR